MLPHAYILHFSSCRNPYGLWNALPAWRKYRKRNWRRVHLNGQWAHRRPYTHRRTLQSPLILKCFVRFVRFCPCRWHIIMFYITLWSVCTSPVLTVESIGKKKIIFSIIFHWPNKPMRRLRNRFACSSGLAGVHLWFSFMPCTPKWIDINVLCWFEISSILQLSLMFLPVPGYLR